MNRSLAPLIISLAIVIFLTMILISTQTPYMNRQNYSNEDNGRNKENLKMRLSPYNNTHNRVANAPSRNQYDNRLSEEELKRMYLKALTLYNDSRFDDAARQIKDVLVFQPDNPKALMLLGKLLYQEEKYKESESVFRRLAKLQPDSPTVYNNLGQSLARQNRFIEAIDILSTAHEKDPKSPIINLNLAGAHAVLGDNEKAVNFFKEAYSVAGKQVLPATKDPTLKSLRDNPDFKKFISECEKDSLESSKSEVEPEPDKPEETH